MRPYLIRYDIISETSSLQIWHHTTQTTYRLLEYNRCQRSQTQHGNITSNLFNTITDDDEFDGINVVTKLPTYFLVSSFLSQLINEIITLSPFPELHQPPSLRPHLIQHLRVFLHQLLSPFHKQQHFLHTDTWADSTLLSSLPQSTALYHKMLHCLLQRPTQKSPQPRQKICSSYPFFEQQSISSAPEHEHWRKHIPIYTSYAILSYYPNHLSTYPSSIYPPLRLTQT